MKCAKWISSKMLKHFTQLHEKSLIFNTNSAQDLMYHSWKKSAQQRFPSDYKGKEILYNHLKHVQINAIPYSHIILILFN